MKKLILLFSILTTTICQAGFQVDQMEAVTATTVSTKVIEGKAVRTYLLIVNDGAVPVIAKVGAEQSANEGIIIPVGGNWEPVVPPSDAIYIKTASSTASVTILTGK